MQSTLISVARGEFAKIISENLSLCFKSLGFIIVHIGVFSSVIIIIAHIFRSYQYLINL